MEEIVELENLEAELREVELSTPGLLRARRFCDPVKVASIGPNGILLAGCPWVEVGDPIELSIDLGDASYRFKGTVRWTGEDLQGDLDVAVTVVGIPVMLRKNPRRATTAPLADPIEPMTPIAA